MIEGVCFCLVNIRKSVLAAMDNETDHKFVKYDLIAHLDYIQDKILTKIASRRLYPRHQVPDCLHHYWDIDGPTYCPRLPIEIEVLPCLDAHLLEVACFAMFEAHREERGYMKHTNFFRMMPLLKMVPC